MIFNMTSIKFCPKCKNTEIIMIAGGISGIFECKKCKFRGSIFPEREKLMDVEK